MRLVSVAIQGFRCYKDEVTVQISDLTTFIGKNDIGKSTVLEALEIFFNNETVKIDQSDATRPHTDCKVCITCEFDDFPSTLNLDAGAETTLQSEYLLTRQGTLKVKKIYDCGNKKPTHDVFIVALHPTAKGVENLIELKEKELQDIVKKKGLDVALKGNAGMRQAIWASEDDLQLCEVLIPVTKPKEDSKRIWDQLQRYLPMFALFQSDRSSRDSDDEVQNPMKAAVTAAMAEVQDHIAEIQRMVQEKVEAIAKNTHAALMTIDSGLANELVPQFTPPTAAKWGSLFSVGMDTDGGIPLNKRGSGVRRLVLVSFFKAEAERRKHTTNSRSIIYAIEEPETAQHPHSQKILIESFRALSLNPGCQVILTTHSPGFASDLPVDSVRFVTRDESGNPKIDAGADVFGPVADALGIVPDNRVKVLFCVEGPNDVIALKHLSRAMHAKDSTLPDLTKDDRVAFVSLGGGTLQQWVAQHYLRPLNRPEFHLYDNDVAKYADAVNQVNARGDGSYAAQTKKHEIESYLHPDAIKKQYEIDVEVPDHLDEHGHAVPKIFSITMHRLKPVGAPMNDNTAKQKLTKVFPNMTWQMIAERDPDGEVEGWFRKLAEMIH